MSLVDVRKSSRGYSASKTREMSRDELTQTILERDEIDKILGHSEIYVEGEKTYIPVEVDKVEIPEGFDGIPERPVRAIFLGDDGDAGEFSISAVQKYLIRPATCLYVGRGGESEALMDLGTLMEKNYI